MDRGGAKDPRYACNVYLDAYSHPFRRGCEICGSRCESLRTDQLGMFVNHATGYCFGGPFALEIATSDNVVAGMLFKT